MLSSATILTEPCRQKNPKVSKHQCTPTLHCCFYMTNEKWDAFSEMATLVMLLLGTSLLTTIGAPAVSRPPKVLAYPSNCQLARFRSLSPQELRAFKTAKDTLEEMLQLKGWNCTGRLFPGKRDLRQLQVWERPVALKAELSLTLQVLGAMAEPSLGPVLDPLLRTLNLIQAELQGCMLPQPTGTPRPRGRLQHWLQRLHEAPQRESQSCLEASVTFNLFRLLTHDLRCVALGALCV
ncbi:interferon lambda-3-like [Suncus etruscus]|uniref:interferon lambda-3-like n=1 Tax=Suncus etruscus TaxID=109475 RepID=UPI00210F9F92|nr:interferon lambda-3-like [Suncus etruscus]